MSGLRAVATQTVPLLRPLESPVPEEETGSRFETVGVGTPCASTPVLDQVWVQGQRDRSRFVGDGTRVVPLVRSHRGR